MAEVPDAKVYRGHCGARKWAEEMLKVVDEWHWSPEEVLLDEGGTVVIRAHVAGRSTSGLPIDMTLFHVAQTRDGKFVSFQGFFDRAKALEAAGLSE